MKWWKYCWAVIGNIIFTFILLAIFNNIADSNTRKLLAASVVIYLCAIGIGVQLTRQISAGFTVTTIILQSVVRKSTRTEDAVEDNDLKDELDAAVVKLHTDIKERDTKMLIHACFSIINCIWMLTILLSNS